MASFGRRDQRGEGKIGLILVVLVLVSVGYLAIKWVPVRTQNAEFVEFVERAGQRFSIGELNEETLVAAILEYATREHIPVTEPNVNIDARQDKVIISVKYHVDIPLVGGKTWTQNYDIRTETPRF